MNEGAPNPCPSTHLVEVVLNVQDLLRQQSQATEQHGWSFMNHSQVDQPGQGAEGRVGGESPCQKGRLEVRRGGIPESEGTQHGFLSTQRGVESESWVRKSGWGLEKNRSWGCVEAPGS